MKELLEMLLGNLTPVSFTGFLIWAFLGAVAYSSLEMSERDEESFNTPKKFSIKFWIFDNWKRWSITFLLIFILFRFYEQLTGQELAEFTAFITGFGSDGISGFSKRKLSILQANRQKLLDHEIR